MRETPLLSPTALEALLNCVPRFRLASLPTPIQDLPRLSEELGGPRIQVKRDDLTGLAFGGNKVRMSEYFVGAALAMGADVLIAGGSFAQSNHARVSSAAARAAGLKPVVVVRPGGPHPNRPGNTTLTRLLADDVRVLSELREVPEGRLSELEARRRMFDAIAEEYQAAGHRPYVVYGTSTGLGAVGYVAAALELHRQFEEMNVHPDSLLVTSMGATQAGLEVGSRVLGDGYRVVGAAYKKTGGEGAGWVAGIANDAADLLGIDLHVNAESVINDDSVAGPGYGAESVSSREAINLCARTEGLLLDPVYTAKGMATLIQWVRDGRLGAGQTVVFLHTGGLPALFAYAGGDEANPSLLS